jgi:hypothetical protein
MTRLLHPNRRNPVAQYIHFGIFLITVPNLIVIVLMLLVFAVAIAVPLPQEHSEPTDQASTRTADHTEGGA